MSITGQASDQLSATVRAVHATDLSPSNIWPAPHCPSRPRESGAPQRKLFLACDPSVWLSIGQCLRAQYDALAPPIPQHLAALVEEFETKK
jgi:hypothetical protein